MKAKIGRLTVDLFPALSRRLIRYLKHQPDWMGIRPRPLYEWDCAEVAPKNPPKPTHVMVEPRLVTHWLSPMNTRDHGKSNRQWTYMLNATGSKGDKALDAALLAAIPARKVPINLDKTTRQIPFDNGHKISVTYQIDYHWFGLRPVPNRAKILCLVGLPWKITILFAVKRYCGPPGIFVLDRTYPAATARPPSGNKTTQRLNKEIEFEDEEWMDLDPRSYSLLLYSKSEAMKAALR